MVQMDGSSIVALENGIIGVAGIYTLIVGWILYPSSTTTNLLKRFNSAILVWSLCCLVLLQYVRYSTEDNIPAWEAGIIIIISVGFSLPAFIITHISTLLSATYICMISGYIAVQYLDNASETEKIITVEIIAIIGGVIGFYLTQKSSRIIGGSIMLYHGGLFFTSSISCLFDIPNTKIIYTLTNVDLYNCTADSKREDLWMALVIALAASLVAIVIQLCISSIVIFCMRTREKITRVAIPVTELKQHLTYSEFVEELRGEYDKSKSISKQEVLEEKEKHKEKLIDRLNDANLSIDQSINSQFLVVSRLLYVHEIVVRMKVQKWLSANSNWIPDDNLTTKSGKKLSLEALITQKNWNKFLESLTTERGPGNFVTLIAIAQCYKKPIEIYTSLSSVNKVVIHPKNLGENEEQYNNVVSIDNDSPVIRMYQYYKDNYGGIKNSIFESDIVETGESEDKADIDAPSVMSPTEENMRQRFSAGNQKLSVLTYAISFLTGVWWLLWLPIWGQDWSNFFSVIGFIIFFIAEFINFVLGMVYMVNFLLPVTRRWKSLNHLGEGFNKRVRCDSMIFHYSEPVTVTADTLDACLKMYTRSIVRSNTYICDDGFWANAPTQTKEEEITIYPWYYPEKLLNDLTKTWKLLQKIPSCCKINPFNNYEILSENPKDIYVDPHVDVCKRSFNKSEELLQIIKEQYKKVPSRQGKQLINEIIRTMRKHYTSQIDPSQHSEVKVHFKTRLSKLLEDKGGKDGYGIIKRRDCAIGSFCYMFNVSLPNDTPEAARNRPCVYLVARLKPSKHHAKAGNINNCLYNEMDYDNNRFVSFFDNDMQPHPAFLMRTLPWFFINDESTGRYFYNRRVSYVQTPQYFSEDTISPVSDSLASKNTIFFRAIQKGRDRFSSCAFAGTNAVFRVGALFAIGGMAYGSQTEDALTGRRLHKAGYKSIYAEEKLAVGEAPTTVGSSMRQRMRWCKGSIQILLLKIFGVKIEDEPVFQTGLAPKKEETDSYLIQKKREQKLLDYIVQGAYSVDTMLYPVSAITAIGYMLVALIFVWSGKSPVTFTGRFGYVAFAFSFVPYFLAKFFSTFIAYVGKVSSEDIWISQEAWFGYAFPAVIGIFDAVREHFTGKGISWKSTGDNERRNWLETFNVIMLLLLVLGIIFRFVHLFINIQTALIDIGAIFFAATIVTFMWKMVSMTLYEILHNSFQEDDKKEDLKRITIPTYVAYVVLLMIVIGIGLIAPEEITTVPEEYYNTTT